MKEYEMKAEDELEDFIQEGVENFVRYVLGWCMQGTWEVDDVGDMKCCLKTVDDEGNWHNITPRVDGFGIRETSFICGLLNFMYEGLRRGYLQVRMERYGMAGKLYAEGWERAKDKGMYVFENVHLWSREETMRWVVSDEVRDEKEREMYEGMANVLGTMFDRPSEETLKEWKKGMGETATIELERKENIKDYGEETHLPRSRTLDWGYDWKTSEMYSKVGHWTVAKVLLVFMEMNEMVLPMLIESAGGSPKDERVAATRLVDDLGTFGNMVLCRAVEGGFVQYGSDGVLKWLDENGQACETATPDWGFFCWKMMYVAPVSKQKLCEAFGRPNNKILLMEKGNKARWVKNDLTAREVEITKLFEK